MRPIDGDKLMMHLADWWYSSFGQDETEEAKAIKAVMDEIEQTLGEFALEKQEQAKEAIPHRNYQYLSDYWCECGWHLGKKGDVKFCADCGKRIKWD